jgi:hypothetical protein
LLSVYGDSDHAKWFRQVRARSDGKLDMVREP